MLKSKLKFVVVLVVAVMLLSTISFATDESVSSLDGAVAGVPIEEIYATAEGTSDEEAPAVLSEGTDEDAIDGADDVSTTADWVNHDLYLTDDKVNLTGVVDGNAFIVGKEVTISAEVGGDVFVCANKVTIDGGYIYSSLFVAANEVVINGIVYDVYAVTRDFTLGTDGYVYRDLRVASNSIRIDGKVRRDAYLTGVNLNINSENGTLIGGNLEYSTSQEITLGDDVVIGEVKFSKEEVKEISVAERILHYVFDALSALVFSFIVVLLAIWLAPNFVEKVSNMSTKKAFASLGVGVVAPVVVIIALVLLLASTVATSVAFAASFVFVAICMASTAVASIYFGNLFAKLVKWDGKVKFVLACLISALAIWLISQIPFIGGLFGYLVAAFGFGTLLINVFFKKSSKTEVKE